LNINDYVSENKKHRKPRDQRLVGGLSTLCD